MIDARDLGRRFGERVAVDGVSLQVPEGTILALLGPNGAGKTTTVRMLTGLLAPSHGEATVAGYDVRRQPAAVRAHVGLVTDSPGLHDQMSPRAYLDFFGQVYGVETERRKRRIDELLEMFDLRDVAAVRMAGFSRGMQQKVALARALLHEPPAIFLDEPTAGLDPLAARMVRELIVGLRNASRAIILCTHDLDEAERLADTIAILREGRVVAADAPQALRAAASQVSLIRVTFARRCADALVLAAPIEGVHDPRIDVAGLALDYQTPDAPGTNPRVIAALVAGGAHILSVTASNASLEDVFARAVAENSAA